MSSEPMIWARGLGKGYHVYRQPIDRLKQMLFRGRRTYYEEFWALRGVDFDVQAGETVGVIGRNGAGKSTLLQLLCGTVAATEGQLRVNGRLAPLLELGAGFNPEFTGRENVFLNAAVLGVPEREIRQRFKAIEAFAGIGDFIDQPVRTYSSGMQARLAFAVAIHTDPDVLIVDEILAVGDAAFQRKCIKRFFELRDSGCTVLLVSHDPYLVKTICQRALYLRAGEKIAFGPADQVVDRYTLELEQAEAAQAPAEEKPAEPPPEQLALFRFTLVQFEYADGRVVEGPLESGTDVQLRVRYKSTGGDMPEQCSFVFNLYRHDDFYVCGTTTLMDGIEPFPARETGEFLVRFPRLCLLAGSYKWRVAINDHFGVAILAQATYQCPFQVVDRFQAHGLVDLPRQWIVEGKSVGSAREVGEQHVY